MLPATRGVSKMPGAMVMTRLLLVGTAAFALIWVVASLSTSPEMLIAARALLGVAGATLMPSTLALIRAMFADREQLAVATCE
jgi:DHA2 family multidrug resistance protein-like MFS transporter